MSKDQYVPAAQPGRELVSFGLLQKLYATAKLVADGGDRSKLRPILASLEQLITFRESAQGQQVLKRAREIHIDSEYDIDIDDSTIVYHNGADGYWVLGWCWINDDDVADEE